MNALPIGSRITAINRTRIVKLRIAFWNKVAMIISDRPVSIRIDCVIRRVRPNIHHFAEFRMVLCFRSLKTLLQSVDRIPIYFCRHPLSFGIHMGDRAMMGSVSGKCAFGHTLAVTIFKRNFPDLDGSNLFAIEVFQFAIRLKNAFLKLIDKIDICRCVHPSIMFGKPLINEELPPCHSAISI